MILKIVISLSFLILNVFASKQVVPCSNSIYESKECLAKSTSKSSDCLNCHDGVSATAKNTSRPQETSVGFKVAQGASSGVHTGSHPIGISYIENKASLKPKGSLLIGKWMGATIISDLLINGKVECTSCHKVDGGNTIPQLLRKLNIKSELCLSCHNN